MKKQILLLLLCLFSFAGGIKAETKTGSCGEAAFWSLDDEGTLKVWGAGKISDYTVTYSGFGGHTENISSPWADDRTNVKKVIVTGVSTIGMNAFYGCKNLTSAIIGSSVTTIRTFAFAKTQIKKDQIPATVTTLETQAIDGYYCGTCGEEYAVNGSKDNIKWTFYDGTINFAGVGDMSYYFKYEKSGLSLSTNIPWYECADKIKNIIIGEGITNVGSNAFRPCNNIETVSLPQSIQSIGGYALYPDKASNSKVTIVLPPNIKNIGKNAFYWKDIKAEFGRTVIALWEADYNNAVDATTGTSLSKNTLCPFKVKYDTSEPFTVKTIITGKSDDRLSCVLNDNTEISSEKTEILKTYVLPETTIKTVITAKIKGDEGSPEHDVFTSNTQSPGFTPIIEVKKKTATSLSIDFSYPNVDSKYVRVYKTDYSPLLTVKQGTKQIKTFKGNGSIVLNGLDPNTSYNLEYNINLETRDYSRDNKAYKTTKTVYTDKLSLTTQQPKVVSVGNVIVAAESNVGDDEQNVGFEWRRTDWSNDFASNTATACIYKGKIEGYIRNLNSTVLWKYRPYYLANSGTYYYGDWVGLDPSNTSYFEPTVHTYDEITVKGNTALVKGYALRGTDGIKVQGFKYWKKVGASVMEKAEVKAPANALTVEATGQVMTATLPDLSYNTDYEYQAFVTTDEGTYYGEVMSFSVGADPAGIENVNTSSSLVATGIYNASGCKIQNLQKGLNIIVYKNGIRKKIYVK